MGRCLAVLTTLIIIVGLISSETLRNTVDAQPSCAVFNNQFEVQTVQSNAGATTHCNLGSKCAGNWRISMMVALTATDMVGLAFGFIHKVTRGCPNQDQMKVINPASLNSKDGDQCQYGNMADTYKRLTSSNVNDYVVPNLLTAGDTVYGLFQQLLSCDVTNPRTAEGAVVYFLTDIPCENLCQGNLPINQSNIIDTLISNGYVVLLINLKDEDCLRTIFPECSKFGATQCQTLAVGTESDAQSSLLDVCSDGQTLPWTIVVSLMIVSMLSIAGFIAVVFLQYRLRKTAGWQKFWQNRALQAQNHEDGLNPDGTSRDTWELKSIQLDINEDKILGQGAFATVYEASIKGGRGRRNDSIGDMEVYKVAAKRLPPHCDETDHKSFLLEIEFMKNLGQHAHIASLIGCISNVDRPVMAMEICEKGDLLSYARTRKEDCEKVNSSPTDDQHLFKEFVSFAWQIADGLMFLEAKQIIHRDLAARNILLTKSLTAKISDFGLCRSFSSSSSAVTVPPEGRLPFRWMALESLTRHQYSVSSDVWSYGVLLFELFSFGDIPYSSIAPSELVVHLREGVRPKRPENCTDEIFKLMESCWHEDPFARKSPAQIRSYLGKILHENSEYYGYITVSQQIGESAEVKSEARKPSYMSEVPIHHMLTKTPNEFSVTQMFRLF